MTHIDKGTQEAGDRCVGGAGKVVMINIVVEIQSLHLKYHGKQCNVERAQIFQSVVRV